MWRAMLQEVSPNLLQKSLRSFGPVVRIGPFKRAVTALLKEQCGLGVESGGDADAVAAVLGAGQDEAFDGNQARVDIGSPARPSFPELRQFPFQIHGFVLYPWKCSRIHELVKPKYLFDQGRSHFLLVVGGEIERIDRPLTADGMDPGFEPGSRFCENGLVLSQSRTDEGDGYGSLEVCRHDVNVVPSG